MTNPDININININLNINMNWADISEDNLITDLYQEIENDEDRLKKKKQKAIVYIKELIDNMNVDFEPDESYRKNVRYMILGLVLCQLLKQKTINLYRKGKEDREYLASFLMMKIQHYLANNFSPDIWEGIIKMVYKEYEGKIKINDSIKDTIYLGLNKKIINPEILVSAVINNKKIYTQIKKTEPKNYI